MYAGDVIVHVQIIWTVLASKKKGFPHKMADSQICQVQLLDALSSIKFQLMLLLIDHY